MVSSLVDMSWNRSLDRWTTVWAYMLASSMTATRAATGAHTTENGTSVPGADRLEPGNIRPEWDVECSVARQEQLGVGDRVAFTKTISEADVRRFAAASGDTNPLHLDDEFAAQTRFDGRVVHGTLLSGLISAALAHFPGLSVSRSQTLEFHNPARIGDRLTAECEIVEELGDGQYRLTTRVVDDTDVLLDGEAVVRIAESPADS